MAVKLDLAGFGKRVGDLRDEAGLTQKQLAAVVGGGDSKVSEWESGKRAPDAESLMRLAVALGTTVDYLLTGEEGAGEWARDRLLALVNELNRGAWREPEAAPSAVPPFDPAKGADEWSRWNAPHDAATPDASAHVGGGRPTPPGRSGKRRK